MLLGLRPRPVLAISWSSWCRRSAPRSCGRQNGVAGIQNWFWLSRRGAGGKLAGGNRSRQRHLRPISSARRDLWSGAGPLRCKVVGRPAPACGPDEFRRSNDSARPRASPDKARRVASCRDACDTRKLDLCAAGEFSNPAGGPRKIWRAGWFAGGWAWAALDSRFWESGRLCPFTPDCGRHRRIRLLVRAIKGGAGHNRAC